jgi:hypothetical protein
MPAQLGLKRGQRASPPAAFGEEKSRKPRFRKIELRKKKRRFRGTPPPPAFDLYALALSQILTPKETAAVIRRSTETLLAWRQHKPDHPLKWRRLAGRRIGYVVCDIRAYLEYQPRGNDDGNGKGAAPCESE